MGYKKMQGFFEWE